MLAGRVVESGNSECGRAMSSWGCFCPQSPWYHWGLASLGSVPGQASWYSPWGTITHIYPSALVFPWQGVFFPKLAEALGSQSAFICEMPSCCPVSLPCRLTRTWSSAHCLLQVVSPQGIQLYWAVLLGPCRPGWAREGETGAGRNQVLALRVDKDTRESRNCILLVLGKEHYPCAAPLALGSGCGRACGISWLCSWTAVCLVLFKKQRDQFAEE